MDIKLLTLAAFLTAILAATMPLIDRNPVIASATGIKQNSQTVTISLREYDLNNPHVLTVSAEQSWTRITGQIELNGRQLQSLNNSRTQINLSPLLTSGVNTLKIKGNYNPRNSSVKIELRGENTQISQQTGGNGILNQVIIIDVR